MSDTSKRADETTDGGKYINEQGFWINAEGEYITADGKPSDKPVNANAPKPNSTPVKTTDQPAAAPTVATPVKTTDQPAAAPTVATPIKRDDK